MATNTSRGTLLPVGVALFAVGLIAVLTVLVLFATGRHDLPVWLSAAAMLTPVGLALGVAGVVLGDRRRHPGDEPRG
jgi:hypothetical protein